MSSGDRTLGGEVHWRKRVFCHILSIPSLFRPSDSVHSAGDSQPAALPCDETGPGPTESSVPREPQEGVQKTARSQLHHTDADRGGHRFPYRRDSIGCYYVAPHHIGGCRGNS